jgi:hypothetical protein
MDYKGARGKVKEQFSSGQKQAPVSPGARALA